MINSVKHRYDIWQQRIDLYGKKPLIRFIDSVIGSAILVFVPVLIAEFEKHVVVFNTIGYLTYITLIILIRILAEHNAFQHIRGKYFYPFLSLLKSIQYLGILSIAFVCAWTSGVYTISRKLSPSMVAITSTVLFVCLLIVTVALFIFFVRGESKTAIKVKNTFTLLSTIIGAVILTKILPLIISSSSGLIIVTMIASVLASFTLLPTIVWGFCEILLIGLGKWPSVNMTDTDAIITRNYE